VVEHYLDTVGVQGSIPCAPTKDSGYLGETGDGITEVAATQTATKQLSHDPEPTPDGRSGHQPYRWPLPDRPCSSQLLLAREWPACPTCGFLLRHDSGECQRVLCGVPRASAELTAETLTAALRELELGLDANKLTRDTLRGLLRTGCRSALARHHAERAVRAGRVEEVWALLREVAESLTRLDLEHFAIADIDPLALANVARLRGLADYFESRAFAALSDSQREDGDLMWAIHDSQRVKGDSRLELLWVEYVQGLYFHVRDEVLSDVVVPQDSDGWHTANAARAMVAVIEDQPEVAELFLPRLRDLGREGRCDCGANLMHVVADGLRATLCEDCDRDSSALTE
jgi:hypothetical protein